MWVLSDATNENVKRFQVYTGRDDRNDHSIGICSRVVLDLMQGFESSGLQLFTNNYYTSPILFNHLCNRGINACGTVRMNRLNFPKVLLTKATVNNRGFYDYRANGSLLAAVWVDKRSVYFVSTFHSVETSQQPLCKKVQNGWHPRKCFMSSSPP